MNLQRGATTANFPPEVRGIVTFLLLASLAAGGLFAASDWSIIRQNGRDYVSFSNVAKFYQFPEYTRVSHAISLRGKRGRIRAQGGTSDLYINGVRFFTDFPIIASGNDELISAVDVNKIIQPILRAHEIKSAQKIETVVLDPGHGGHDSGATNRWGAEKSFALDVARHCRQQLLQAGYKVEMTRNGDTFIPLEERVIFANRFPKSLFVSIHFNMSGSAEGLETYALAPAGVVSNAVNEAAISDTRWCPGNAQDEQNIALAAAVHAMSLSQMGMFDRGVKHSRFHVLRNIKIPGVLIECGFLSNIAEGQRIATPLFRQQIGYAIAQGIQRYDAAVNFRAEAQTLAMAKTMLPLHSHSISEPLSDYVPADPRKHDKPSISISGGD